MKAIIQTETNAIKYLFCDDCTVLIGADYTAIASVTNLEENGIINDLNIGNAKLIENFPVVPKDFMPDAYCYDSKTDDFFLNSTHSGYQELLDAQQVE